MSTSILITGCSGFVGENVVSYFLRHTRSISVIGIDQIQPSVQDSRFQFHQMDLRTMSFDKLGRIDAVVHLAGQPSVWVAEENFVLDFEGTKLFDDIKKLLQLG